MYRQKRRNVPATIEFALRCGHAVKQRVFRGSDSGLVATDTTTESSPVATPDELAETYSQLGIQPGSTLILHSDSSAIEELGWSLTDFLDWLQDYLGPNGTLVLPTHPRLKERDDRLVYNPRRSPSKVGMLTELFRRRSGVSRSRFPYSAAAASGPNAEFLLNDHERSFAPHDEHSPYAKLTEVDGISMCIGCPLDRMTILHVAEDTSRDTIGIDGFYQEQEVWLEEKGAEDRSVMTHTRAAWLWWYLSLYQWTYQMYRRELATEKCIGRVPFRVAKARPTVEWMRAEIESGRSLYPLAKMNRFLHLGSPLQDAA